MDTELVKPGTLRDFCDKYAQGVAMVEDALTKLIQASTLLGFRILPDRGIENHCLSYQNGDHLRKSVADVMQRNAWHNLLELTGVLPVMIERKRNDARKAIDTGDVPPVTFENVVAMLSGLRGDIDSIVKESIAEASRILRPHNSGYATNSDGWQLGERCIVEYVICNSYGSIYVNHSRDADLCAIDNAFHLLDGKGVPEYEKRITAALRLAVSEARREFETDYFRCKWYKKGTLHIQFKRADLVAELNRAAADHVSLRGRA